jgi:hypothetical protein
MFSNRSFMTAFNVVDGGVSAVPGPIVGAGLLGVNSGRIWLGEGAVVERKIRNFLAGRRRRILEKPLNCDDGHI